MRRRIAALGTSLAALALVTSGSLSAPAHAQATSRSHGTLVSFGSNQSGNWSGYNQGTLEKSNTLFNQISGDWTVPTATQHKAGQAEYSSSWIGIGGGCIDAGCTVGDNTLIQTGTEQDVDASGHASYSAWYELIPAPGLTISGFPVSAGDKMHADIHEVVADSNVWTITITDTTKKKTFTTTVPYSSTHATAEWIEETPVVIDGTGSGISALPKLSTVHFDTARVNNKAAGLKSAEEMQLVDANNKVLATPSAPDTDRDGFNDCTFATSCAAPTAT